MASKTEKNLRRQANAPVEQDDVLADELFDVNDLPEPSDTFKSSSKLADPNIYNMILDYLREGNYIRTAAEASGVTLGMIEAWLRRGEQGKNKIYYQFYVDASRAIAEGESKLVGKVMKAADDDWKAAMAILSRRHRSRWGDNRTGTGEGSGQVVNNDNRQILAVQASNDPESRDLIRKLVDRTGGDQ